MLKQAFLFIQGLKTKHASKILQSDTTQGTKKKSMRVPPTGFHYNNRVESSSPALLSWTNGKRLVNEGHSTDGPHAPYMAEI